MLTLNPLGLVKNVTGTATSLVRGAAELGLTVAGTVGEQVFRRIPGVTGDGPEPVDVVEEDDVPEPVNVVEEDDAPEPVNVVEQDDAPEPVNVVERSSPRARSPPRSPRSTPRLIPARSSSRRPTLLSRSSGDLVRPTREPPCRRTPPVDGVANAVAPGKRNLVHQEGRAGIDSSLTGGV